MEAFIRKHGVTKCPGFGTPELADLNVAREEAWNRRNKHSWGYKGR